MYKNKENLYNEMKYFEKEYEGLRNDVNTYVKLETEDREQINKEYHRLHDKISAHRNRIDNFLNLEGIDLFFGESILHRADYNSISMQNSIIESKLNQKYFYLLYNLNDKELTENIDKNNELIISEFDKLDKEQNNFREQMKEIDNIKNNLFNFFGLIVGLLAFIFVNYQFISSAKDLGIGKMLMFLGIANVGLILGIFLILGILGDLLGQPEKLKNSLKVMKSGWLFLGIISIIVIGFSLDLFDRSENYKNIDENINKVQERVEMHDADLYNELHKRDLEIEKLKLEIENLKNKK